MDNYEYGFITKCAEYRVNPKALIMFAQEHKRFLESIKSIGEILRDSNENIGKDETAKDNKFNYDNALTKLKETNPRAYKFYIEGGANKADKYYNDVLLPTLKDPNNPYKPVLDGPYKTNPNYPILRALENGDISEIGPDDIGYTANDPNTPATFGGYTREGKVKLLNFFKDKNNPFITEFDPIRTTLHEHIAHNFRGDGYSIAGKQVPYRTVYENPEIESDLASAYPQLDTNRIPMYRQVDKLLDKRIKGISGIRTKAERGALNTELQWEIYNKLSNKAGRPITPEEFREGIKNLSDTELSQIFANKVSTYSYLSPHAFDHDTIVDGGIAGGTFISGLPDSPMIRAHLRRPHMTFDEFRDTQLYNLNKDHFDKVLDYYSNPDPNREKILHIPYKSDDKHLVPHPDTLKVPIKRSLPPEQLEAMRKTLMWLGRNKNNKPTSISQNQRYLT